MRMGGVGWRGCGRRAGCGGTGVPSALSPLRGPSHAHSHPASPCPGRSSDGCLAATPHGLAGRWGGCTVEGRRAHRDVTGGCTRVRKEAGSTTSSRDAASHARATNRDGTVKCRMARRPWARLSPDIPHYPHAPVPSPPASTHMCRESISPSPSPPNPAPHTIQPDHHPPTAAAGRPLFPPTWHSAHCVPGVVVGAPGGEAPVIQRFTAAPVGEDDGRSQSGRDVAGPFVVNRQLHHGAAWGIGL